MDQPGDKRQAWRPILTKMAISDIRGGFGIKRIAIQNSNARLEEQ